MSISQTKKQFDSLMTHLHRDAKGVELLKPIRQSFSEFRRLLAAAAEAATAQTAIIDTVSQRNRELNAEKDAALEEVHRLKQVVSNLERDLKLSQDAAAAAVAAADGAPVLAGDADAARSEEFEIKRVMKRLRKRMKFCPPPMRRAREACELGHTHVYSRESLAAGWSNEELWTLGASVAVLAGYAGIIVIETKYLLSDFLVSAVLEESAGRQIYRWVSRYNINKDAVQHQRVGFADIVNIQNEAYE